MSKLIAAMVAEGQTIRRIEQKKQLAMALLILQSTKDYIDSRQVVRITVDSTAR